ncbi:MAG: phosphomannomutase/phosphoglucomutase [Candidatus Kerfeldbacteria bacterium]|nr:phosphomannomutase/phosphoglucomutase [Candidatus Kerfeldbacteria bacterium]
MQVTPSIFKSYDIRGTYPDQLNADVAYAVGRSFSAFLGASEVIVGRDMRLSGPELFAAVTRGLMEQGTNVVDIGMVSTDQYYFACATLGLPGIMVTASHNPPQYNGFKMVKRMPQLLSGEEGIQDIRRLVESEDWPVPSRMGTLRQEDVHNKFTDTVMGQIDATALRPLRVLADTANGMVGPSLTRIFAQLPSVSFTGMYLEPDGNIPHHGLDPLQPENRAELQRRVVEEGYDVGFAFDGDGDRFFVIDDCGTFVSGDFLTALLGQYLLKKYPGSKVIYDVRASWAVADMITAAGGTPLMERVGHTYIKKRMASEQAVFGGEVTGHYYFLDFFCADSGVIPALLVLEMLSTSGRKLSELLEPLAAKYFISGEINTKVAGDPQQLLEQIVATYPDGTITRLDGVSVTYPDWHFNVRTSNTEPLIRLNLEARSRALMEQKRDEVLALIRT